MSEAIMKFQDIKPGDVVYRLVNVMIGFKSGPTFFLPVKVDRVTKTQIIAEGGRRKKNDGGPIGNMRSKVYKEGELVGSYGKVFDQSEQYRSYKNLLAQLTGVSTVFTRLSQYVASNRALLSHQPEVVEKLTELQKAAKQLLEQTEEIPNPPNLPVD